MFSFRKKAAPRFDRAGKIPVIRSSICTGEKTAGYKDVKTGKYTEVMLIRGDRDLRDFLDTYGFTADEITYEW